jgi:hypothetical protein
MLDDVMDNNPEFEMIVETEWDFSHCKNAVCWNITKIIGRWDASIKRI